MASSEQKVGNGNHVKGVTLQGFKGFKLKGNCQILIKSNFKNATSRPVSAKKEEKVTNSIKLPSTNFSPPKLSTPLLPMLSKAVSPAKNLSSHTNQAVVKEPAMANSFSEPQTLPKTPKKEPEKCPPRDSSKVQERTNSKQHFHSSLSSSEISNRHRSPTRNRQSLGHERHSQKYRDRKHSRSHERRPHSSDERYSPKRRRSSGSREKPHPSRKRQLSNGVVTSAERDGARIKHNHERRLHRSRSPEKHTPKKPRTNLSDGDMEVNDLHMKSPSSHTGKNRLLSTGHTESFKENSTTKTSNKAVVQKSVVPLASIGCWLDGADEEEEDFNADSPCKTETKSPLQSVESEHQTNRNVFDSFLSNQQLEPCSLSSTSSSNPDAKTTSCNDEPIENILSKRTDPASSEGFSSDSKPACDTESELADEIKDDSGEELYQETNSILVKLESELIESNEIDKYQVDVPAVETVSNELALDKTSEEDVKVEKPVVNGEVENNDIEDIYSNKTPKLDQSSLENKQFDFDLTNASDGLYQKQTSDMPTEHSISSKPIQDSIQAIHMSCSDESQDNLKPSTTSTLQNTEQQVNNKPMLPAKKRCREWFQSLAEEEKQKPVEPKSLPSETTTDTISADQEPTEVDMIGNDQIPLTCPASPESPLFSPGSESPLQAPQMTAFDDLSSASGTEDYDPVVEIRIPIDGEEDKLQGNSKIDESPPIVAEIEERPTKNDAEQQESTTVANSELESDVVSDASMLDEGCRRSARIKTKQERTKPRIVSRLNCESATTKPDVEAVVSKMTGSPIVDHMTSSINAIISNKIETGEISADERPPSFEVIAENIYLAQKKKSRVRKEIRRMVCECANMEDDGRPPCGENCLNRLLMIECSSRCPFEDHCLNKRFQRFEYEPTQVFRTSWKGWGLQASQAIGAGNLVMEYCGEVLDQAEFERRSQVYSMQNQQHFYFMALSQEEIIDAMYKGNISRFINHSCDPNCETQKWTVNGRLRVGFFSIRNIEKGEEITFDYQFERYGKEAQKCFCGSSNCRGYLGKAPSEDSELDDTKWNKWDASLVIPPAVDVEQQKQMMKKKKKKGFADNTLESEIFRLRTGLQTNKDVLLLSRSMVRCDTMDQRLLCLKVLCTTENQVCLRSFLQLHGLPLLWSWMVDLSATSASDVDSTTSQLRLKILNTLSVLPITNKNILEDSKVLSMVKRWSEEEQGIQESMQAKKIDPELVTESAAPTEEESTTEVTETAELKSEQMETETDVTKPEVIPDQVDETQNQLEESLKISALTEKLLDLWKDLKEIYRIPKRQRSPIKVPQGGDSERSLEERSSSQASSPSVGNHGDSNQGDWSTRHHDNDRDKSPLRSRSRFDRESGREWDKNRQRDGDKRGMRRSPTRRLRESESKYGRQSSNEREESGKYSWLNESASRLSREEHRRQFERDARNREDDKKKHKDSSLAPSSGHPIWPQQATNSTPSQAALGQQSILGNPPGVISNLPDSATFTPSGYSGNLIQINPIPEPPLLPNPVVYTNQDQQQSTFAYAADGQVLLQSAAAAPQTFLSNDQQCQSITVIGAPAPPSQKPLLHLEPTRTTPENFAAILHSFPQAATYPSGISVLASHANQAIVLLTTDQLNALLTNLPVPEPIVQQQPTLTVNPPVQVPAVITNTTPVAAPPPEINDPSLEELSTVSETASKAASPPRDPRPPRLPPNWKTASDADGCVYYYHVITRQTQWDPPTWDGTEEDLIGKKEGEMDISSTPTSEDGVKKINDKLTGSASIASDTESAKKSRETFRSQMSQHVVQCLSAYRKSDCKTGRITSTDDFKHLARKLTHNVLTKEIKQVQVWEDLECNANVKHKAKEYVRKYMAKCGPIYKGRDDDQR